MTFGSGSDSTPIRKRARNEDAQYPAYQLVGIGGLADNLPLAALALYVGVAAINHERNLAFAELVTEVVGSPALQLEVEDGSRDGLAIKKRKRLLHRTCCDHTRSRRLKTFLDVHLYERFVFDEQDGVIVQPVGHHANLRWVSISGLPATGSFPLLSYRSVLGGTGWAFFEFSLTMPTPPLVRILVIDDEPIVRLDAREILEDAGYVVTEAASADAAMPLLSDGGTVEAILTDIDMPGTLDGLQLARIVDGLMPEVAIVIMSGHELPRREDLPLKSTFVAKPFSASVLLQRMAEALVEV